MSDLQPDGETALQHHLEDEPLVRRLLGTDSETLRAYAAGFVAGWDRAKRYFGAAKEVPGA